uniref:PCI domain-containing protein n=1 Tax=Panagrellus redivivus TaxID=6233 RepID=A0A7E4VEK1_PANRE
MSHGRVLRPDAVLKRAEEFIAVGKDSDALTALHETIKDRRHKQWTPTHEQIMLKHLELCVKLRNAGTAKDALYQYKSLTQQMALASLETVMRHLLKLAEAKAETAQKESIEKVEEIDDLDSGNAPESLLLSVVSGAASQDRMDRTVLSPWLRFLWDSYRNCLDLLRNNNLVEHLYHQIARQSFAFCVKYQRRNEFRKLCDLLRLHLSQLQKNIHANTYNNNNLRINLADSLTNMQETRLIQLDTAIQMELWQEAYKSSEDLHNLMQLGKEKDKRTIKPQAYVNYFEKLSLIFWKSGNSLFHTAALVQKFTIHKEMKKTFAGDEATDQATRVLLAALSIADDFETSSILAKNLDMEDMHLSNVRVLSALLRLPIAPTRAGLLREIARLNAPEIALEPVANLYRVLEQDFAPLDVALKANEELSKIEALGREDYSQYISSIRAVVATKILKALTNIYDALPLDRMTDIIPFYTRNELEHFLVHITKQRFLKTQVDHREKCIRFGPIDATLSGDVETEAANVVQNGNYRGGYESFRVQLTNLYRQLGATANAFDADKIREENYQRFLKRRQIYEFHKDADYERIMGRKKIIENHKESTENRKQQKMQKVQAEAAKKEEKRRAEELKRLVQEQEESEQKRRQAEKEEVQRKVRLEQLKRFQANPIYSQIVKEKGEEALQDMDPEYVVREQRERMDAERREQAIKMLQQERKYDYYVRAFAIEERQMAKKLSDERRAAAAELFKAADERRIAKAYADRQRALDTYKHLEAAKTDAIKFIRSVVEAHKDDLEKKKHEFAKKLAVLKEKKLAERRIARERERRKQWEQSKKDAREREDNEERARRENEREERSAAIQAARDRGRGGREFDNRRGEDNSLMDSKAENDGDWRRGPGGGRDGPPRFDGGAGRRPIVARPQAASSFSNDGPAEDGPSAWRNAGPLPPQRDVVRGPPRDTRPPPPRDVDTAADHASTWRNENAPAPAAAAAAPVHAVSPPAPKPGKYVPPSQKAAASGSSTGPSPPGKYVPPVRGPAASGSPDGPAQAAPAPAAGGNRFSNLGGDPSARFGGQQRRDFGGERDGAPPRRDFGNRDDGPPRRNFGDRDGAPPRRDFGNRDDGPQRRDFGGEQDGAPPRRDFGGPPRRGAPPAQARRGAPGAGGGSADTGSWR